MMYQRVPTELTEASLRGKVMSAIATASIATLFLLETKEYVSPSWGADLTLARPSGEDPRVRLNFEITMMDLPCEQATVDVHSTVGFEKNVTKNVRKYPVDGEGVRQRYEARNWHQDDVELWDPAVPQTIEDLHADGEDAIALSDQSFPYALEEFPYLFVKFYRSGDCTHCDDLAPTWEALGEVITDTAMTLVDEYMEEDDEASRYSDDEYEAAVNRLAPVLVTKLDCAAYPSVCNEQKIRAYPTLRAFVDGEAKGDYNGHRTVMELVHWLSHIEADNREPGELKMQSVVEHASERTIRNDEEEEWNEALTYYRAPRNSWNVTRHPGCTLSGNVMVDKAPGKFLIHAQSYGHDMAAHMTNLSHIVHHFSFGDPDAQTYVEERGFPGMASGFVESLRPMDGNVYVTGELHQAYHHHLRVVATEFGDGKVFRWAGEKIRRVFRILQNSQLSTYRRHIVPEAKFSYDLSPIAVSYLEESRSWYDYLTGVLAIVGGAFTVVGMLDSGLSTLSRDKRRPQYCY